MSTDTSDSMLPVVIAFAENYYADVTDRDAFATLRANPEATRATLAGIIDRIAAHPENYQDAIDESACVAIILPLLCEFGTPDALDGLLAAVSHDEEALDPDFSDLFLDIAPHAFAACAASDPARLLRMAETHGVVPAARYLLMAGAIRLLLQVALTGDQVATTARIVLAQMRAEARAALEAGVEHDTACTALCYLVGDLCDVLPHALKDDLLAVFADDLMLFNFMRETDISAPRYATDELACAHTLKAHPAHTDALELIDSWIGSAWTPEGDGPDHFMNDAPYAPERLVEGCVPGKTFVRSTPKTGANEPCPCGSGKKYKKCCGN